MTRSILAILAALVLAPIVGHGPDAAADDDYTYLGRLGGNRYSADSTANPLGVHGSRLSPTSINNPLGRWGSPLSPQGVRNRHTTEGPKIIAPDGKFLGRLNSNRFDPSSVANPHGRYGSRFSPDSINNPHGRYGSRFSPNSPNNPHATSTPILIGK